MNFLESLLRVLLKGGDTDANASIVLALVGSIAGYNAIPNYFKHKITNFRMKQSPRPRSDEFSPFNII